MRLLPPPGGVAYPQLLRREPFDVVRPLLTLFLGLAAFAMVSVIAQAVLGATWLVAGRPGAFAQWFSRGIAFERPDGMLAAHLGLAALVPLVLLVMAGAARLAPRWVHSVQPGFRWRYCAMVAALAAVVIVVGLLATQRFDWTHPVPQHDYGWFLLVIVVTAPLQAAGEEYLFRGLVMTTLGSYVRNPWFGIVASALVFALFHGVQSPALFADRFAFGLLAGVLVWRTGGLEAGIAIHAVNNVLAFATAGLFGTIAEIRGIATLTWAQAVADIATFLVAAGAAWWLGRRLEVATRTPDEPTPAPVLHGSRPVRYGS